MADINGIEDLSVRGRNLALYIENERHVYDAYLVPVARNLQKKWLAGEFDLTLGIKTLRTYVVLPAAKSHHQRHGGFAESLQQAFPLQDRTDVAEYLARSLTAEWRLGNLL